MKPRSYFYGLLVSLLMLGLGLPVHADRAPASWAIGKFSGYDKKHGADIELTIRANGKVVERVREGGNWSTISGEMHGRRFTVSGAEFRASRTANGFRLEQAQGGNNIISFRRVRDSDENDIPSEGERPDDRLPRWAIGTFRGPDRKYNAEIRLTIRDDGSVTNRVRQNGKLSTQQGTYRQGHVVIYNVYFALSRTDDGIRLVQENERDHVIRLRRD